MEYTNIFERHLREVVDPTWNYAGRLKDWDDHVWNAVAGLSGEAGEVLDIHKKMWFHAEKDRRTELLHELGDVSYYLPKLVELHGFTMEEVLEANRIKLFERYAIDHA